MITKLDFKHWLLVTGVILLLKCLDEQLQHNFIHRFT